MMSIDKCNATSTEKKARSPSAAIVVKLPAPIVVKIRGMELRVVQLAKENFGMQTS